MGKPGDLGVLPALVAAGKVPKVALAACMRKLLVILNAVLKHRMPWCSHPVLDPQHSCSSVSARYTALRSSAKASRSFFRAWFRPFRTTYMT